MRTAPGSRVASALAVLLLAGCAHEFFAAGTPGAPSLKLEKCGIANVMEPVYCGDLPVPEDRAHPEGRKVALNIVVVPALGDKTLPALYDLAGGPGLPATGSAGFWAADGAIHRAHRDIVMVDQRGTGASGPLPCALYTANPYREVLDARDAAACRDKLAASADLSKYSTAAAVEDLEAVRVARGDERIDLHGLSYGTRVAQEYLRAHPDRVRTMVLMGTLGPQEKLPLSFGRNAADALARLSSDCRANPACRKAVPRLDADVAAVQKKFVKGELNATLASGTRVTVLAGPFWEAVRAQLVSVRTQRQLPWLLHEAAAGRFAPILGQLAPHPERTTLGALLSVSCPEDTAHIADADLATSGGGVFGSYRTDQQRLACQAWGQPAVDVPRDFVDSPVPVLLLAGEADALTPPQQAQDVASHLPNARVVTIPKLGHAPDGLTHMECYDKLIAAFFDAASASKLDTGCVAAMQPPPFRTAP